MAGAAGAARGTAASMRDPASSMSGRIADTADRTRRQATDAMRQGRESAASFISEQPLLCAAIGVAVGAAIASMLPSTETEDQLMGETSDAVKGAAGQVGSDALESAKNVANKVADRAQSAVKEEGLSPSAVAEAARNLGEEIQQGAQAAMKQPMTGAGPQEGTAAFEPRLIEVFQAGATPAVAASGLRRLERDRLRPTGRGTPPETRALRA